jgi:RNA polymerase sigma factor for flagellar operon FliA
MGTTVSEEIELWREYRRTRATGLRDQLIEKHLVLVKYAAARVAGRLPGHFRLDDLYSAGLVGFLAAVEDFDPERNVEFGAYASQRIRGAILDELRRLDCVPRRVRRLAREAAHAIGVLTQRLGRQPLDEEIAAEMKIEVAVYRRLLTEGVTLLSLDADPSGEQSGAPVDSIEDPSVPDPFATLEARERQALVARFIEKLPERERQVLALYYHEELTMHEVGTILGITESRVSQIHSSAILRLQAAVRREQAAASLGKTPARARARVS